MSCALCGSKGHGTSSCPWNKVAPDGPQGSSRMIAEGLLDGSRRDSTRGNALVKLPLGPPIRDKPVIEPEWRPIPGRRGWFESTAKNPDGSRRKTFSPYGSKPEPSVPLPPQPPHSHQPYIPPDEDEDITVYVSPDDPYAVGGL